MIILEILKYTLPSMVVFLTAFYLLKQQNEKDLKVKELEDDIERRKNTNQVLLPIRLQAYERLTLFLERVHPHQLIIRNNKSGLNSMMFQSILIKAIRDEFEHNLSQQLYVSDVAWTKVQKAKEECIKQINFSASKIDSQSTANDLGTLIIQNFSNISPDPIQVAINQLKSDVHKGL